MTAKQAGPIDNDELRQLLDALRDEDGLITPEAVVKAASNPKHRLHQHPDFCWGDDLAAAYQHRLEVAARLIRRVPFVRRETQRQAAKIPCYVRAPRVAEGERGHVAVATIEPASGDAAVVVLDEIRRVIGSLRRASGLAAHLKVAAARDRLSRMYAEALALQASLEEAQCGV